MPSTSPGNRDLITLTLSLTPTLALALALTLTLTLTRALAPAPTPRSDEARAAAAAQAEALPYIIERAAEAAGAVLEADGADSAADWAWREEDIDPEAEGGVAQRLAAR